MINGRRAPKTRLGGSARCSVGAVALAWLLISLLSSPAQAQSPPSNPAPKQDSDPSRWAVIIGVNTYSQSRALHPLRGPGNDAKNLTDVLISYGRFAPDHILVLADGTATPPTNDNITIAFSRVAKEVPEDGLLVIFFAGHGIALATRHICCPRTSSTSRIRRATPSNARRCPSPMSASSSKAAAPGTSSCSSTPVGMIRARRAG